MLEEMYQSHSRDLYLPVLIFFWAAILFQWRYKKTRGQLTQLVMLGFYAASALTMLAVAVATLIFSGSYAGFFCLLHCFLLREVLQDL